MTAHGSAKMVNNGTINVGSEGTTQTGMVGMQLASDATTNGVIENNGTINIYASNSYAFSKLGANGHIVNNGTVYIDDSVTGSGLIKQAGTAMAKAVMVRKPITSTSQRRKNLPSRHIAPMLLFPPAAPTISPATWLAPTPTAVRVN